MWPCGLKGLRCGERGVFIAGDGNNSERIFEILRLSVFPFFFFFFYRGLEVNYWKR